MRQISLSVGLLLITTVLFAQKDLPAFGKIDKKEFTSLECSYDPDAEAEMLVNAASLQYILNNDIVTTEVEYRVRIKILKEKGVDRGNISIPYYNVGRDETISKIEATTYNMDASGNLVASKLEKQSIYNQVRDKRWSELVFSMPAVKVGSIIEYRFVQYLRGLSIDTWYFQHDIPTRISFYDVKGPAILKFEETSAAYQTIQKEDRTTSSDFYKSYAMRNVPAARLEPFTSSLKDYRQKMDFELVGIDIPGLPYRVIKRTWKELGMELLEDEDFGTTLNKNLELSPMFQQQLKLAGTEYQKMAAIHDHVRSLLTWNKKHSMWAMDGIRKCWQSKTGNSAEINLILINLLKDANLQAYPILVSTRDNGRVNRLIPNTQHFNSVMACVRIDSSIYILDATDRFTPSHMVPHSVANTDGLVLISKQQVQWMTMVPNNQRYRLTVMVQGEIKDDGSLAGHANINSFGYSRANRLQVWNTDKDHFSDKFYDHAAPNIRIDSFSVRNEKNDSLPLEQEVSFKLNTMNSGEYNYFSPNLFLGLENNQFIAEKRTTDIDFGYNQSYLFVGSFKVPDDYVVEELPKNKRLVLPDKSINLLRVMELTDQQVNIRIVLDFTQPAYALDTYDDFRVFYKMLYDMLNEQVVIHKKKA